jgi:sugar phosphate isomerase/epimerase
MKLALGVDTLSYHCRIEAGEVSHQQICREVSALGFTFLQLNAYHLRAMSPGDVTSIRKEANSLGLDLTLSGDVIGRAMNGDTVESGVQRVAAWIELAQAIGSPFVRVSSGFYRNELLQRPGAILRERDYVIRVLSAAAEQAPPDCTVLLENHSDFTPEEYVEIVEQVGADKMGVFLDLINPMSMFLDPLPVVCRLVPWARAGHVKDYRLVSEYVDDGFHRRGFQVQFCYPGEGIADIRALVGALLEAGDDDTEYRLSIEGLDSRAGHDDQAGRLRESLACLRAIVADDAAGRARSADPVRGA